MKNLLYVLTASMIALFSSTNAQFLTKLDGAPMTFDSVLKEYGPERMLDSLIQVKLENKFLRYDTNLKIKNIWYCSGYAYKRDVAVLSSQGLADESYIVSLKIKALYWTWLIYSDSLNLGNKGAVLVDVDQNEYNQNEYKFDYENTHSNADWLKSIFRKTTSNWITEVETTFTEWGKLYKQKGLDYLRKNKISPLNSKYKFEIIKD